MNRVVIIPVPVEGLNGKCEIKFYYELNHELEFESINIC